MSDLAAGNGRSPTDVASPTQNSDLLGVSDSSNSPQTPRTPQLYGRMRPRYPQELGRVPLHRRGTSKKFERLEDLLKEAGYKETRIFTPETERTGKCEDDDDDATVVEDKRTSVVKDVVGFLAGLIPGVGASVAGNGAQSFVKVSDRSTNNASHHPSPPLPPLVNEVTLPPISRHHQTHHVDPHPTQSERPQIVIHPTTPHHDQAPGQQSHQGPPASPHHLHAHKRHPAYHIKPHGPGGANIHLTPPHITANAHHPRPSRATAYLRHMASAPNVIPKRPNSASTGFSHSHRSSSRVVSSFEGDSYETLRSQSGDRGSNGQQPPLPSSWLETVAKAVLFGGSGAHVGGPAGHQVAHPDSNHQRAPVRHLRPSRSSLSQVSHNSRYYSHHQYRGQKYPLSADRGGLSDSTNFTPSTANSSAFLSPGLPPPMPPALFSQIERGRADRCVSEVTLTRVMCRSAPGSRSGSVVRSEGVRTGAERNSRKNLDVELGVDMEREARGRKRGVKRRGAGGGWLKGRDKEHLRVPSLARMHVEGDVWSSNMKTRKRSRPEPGITFGKGEVGYASEGEVAEYESYSDESEEDEDEEGEVDLARMLLPPKRQNSIRSLRKHLLASVADPGGGGAHSKLRRVHHLASTGRKGGGLKPSDGRLRRQSSWAASLTRNGTDEEREDDHVFWQDTRHNAGVLSPNLNSRGYVQSLEPAPPGRRNTGNSDRESRNGGPDGEDDSFNGFIRDPMGSGRSSSGGQRQGIESVWGVIGGRGS